ncbi:hypothetical protein Tco_0422313 [Tanacetum coccineum]
MTSFDYRLNRLKTIKECSLCGALYTSDYCCSKEGIVDKIIRELPSPSCARCGTPVDGPQCRGCALLRKKIKEDLFTYCVENGIFQDLQDTSESSDDNTNVVNAPQEPFVVKQDPDNPQSPPHIDHFCHKCGDSLDEIFCRRCTYDTIAITPVLPIKEPDNSLSMGDEHLDTVPETKSDEVIKSSVEDRVPIPSESEGIPEKMCDVPLYENTTPLNALNEHSEIVVDSNNDSTSSNDDSPYGEDIDYVDVSPPDAEIVSLEVVEIVVSPSSFSK